MKKVLTFLMLLLSSATVFAQGLADTVPMADEFKSNGKIYVVILVLSLVFVGLAVYLVIIDRKVSKLEKQLKEKGKY